MAVGSFMGKTFTVSSKKILTASNLSGSTGADFAENERLGKKARSQYLGPKLKSYSLDIVARTEDGVKNVRSLIRYFQKKSEAGKADYFVIGGSPLSSYPFIITEVSDAWDVVVVGGALTQATITLKIEEYVSAAQKSTSSKKNTSSKKSSKKNTSSKKSSKKSTSKSTSITAGASVKLTNAPFYVSSTAKQAAAHKSGTFYFYDGTLVSGRYRMTNLSSRCGKLPVGKNVTGWVPASYCGG